MHGLLITIVVLQSISLLVQLSHAGATQKLLTLALSIRRH